MRNHWHLPSSASSSAPIVLAEREQQKSTTGDGVRAWWQVVTTDWSLKYCEEEEEGGCSLRCG